MSRRSSRLASAVVALALAACGVEESPPGSGAAKSARTVADTSFAGRRFASAETVDSLAVAHPERETTWALVRGRLLPVPGGAALPDSADAEVRVFVDGMGRVQRHVEVPASASGDWTLALFHYFDDAGRTTVFRSIGGYFRGDCPTGVVRDRRRTAYDDAFRPVLVERRLEDNEGRPVSESRCGHPYTQFGGNPQRDLAALRKIGLAP